MMCRISKLIKGVHNDLEQIL